jgi:hypothetical protein
MIALQEGADDHIRNILLENNGTHCTNLNEPPDNLDQVSMTYSPKSAGLNANADPHYKLAICIELNVAGPGTCVVLVHERIMFVGTQNTRAVRVI